MTSSLWISRRNTDAVSNSFLAMTQRLIGDLMNGVFHVIQHRCRGEFCPFGQLVLASLSDNYRPNIHSGFQGSYSRAGLLVFAPA